MGRQGSGSKQKVSKDQRDGAVGYHEIALALQEWIKQGRYRPGDMLPTEMAMAGDFGVSRLTVRRAMAKLQALGMVVRQQGRGTYVRARALAEPVISDLKQYNKQLMENDEGIETIYLGRQSVKPNEQLRALFNLEALDLVVEMSFRRMAKDIHFAHVVSHMPAKIADLIPDADLGRPRAVTKLLAKLGHRPHRIRQSIGAQMAEPTVARILGIRPGLPLLRRVSLLQDRSGYVYQRIVSYYRADAFEYDIEFVNTE